MTAAFSLIPSATLFAMMLALGMELRTDDFRRLLQQPRAVVFGAVGQLVLLPAVAFVLIHALTLPAATALGLVLIAACPGGSTSNVFSRYARGDVALSISLTAISSVLAPVSVPVVMTLGMYAVLGAAVPLKVSVAEMVGGLLATTALPVLLGMLCLRRWPAAAIRLRGPLLACATGVLVLLIIGLGVNTVRSQPDPAGILSRSLLAVTSLIALAAGAAAVGCRWLSLSGARTRTLVIEIGVQNVNLALVVALAYLGDEAYLGPALVYLPVMLLFAAGMIAGSRRHEIIG